MTPRPYQIEAGEALDQYLATHDDNPVIEIPTAGGKTPIMAWTIQRYLRSWPGTRILILAHVRELLQQGVDKMLAIWPDAPIGVYCSALKRRDLHAPITYASIQSIHRKAFDFRPFDLVFVDEAHRIPLKGETTYRKFLADARVNCPHLRVVGWTATPYRLGGGRIYGPEFVLNGLAYRANVRDLVEAGYLCRLRSKLADAQPDLAGVRTIKGEFAEADLDARLNQSDVVAEAVAEAVQLLRGRKSTLFFCVSIAHAEAVSGELARHCIRSPVISAKTPPADRARLIAAFVAGEIPSLSNVNVLSEGFDAQRVDGVVMLRPTQSAALYYQQVGRGLRLHPSKSDCLILDFAGNILRHGPIDNLSEPDRKGNGVAPMKRCPQCKEACLAGLAICPDCGFEFPPPERDETPPHFTKPVDADVLSADVLPWQMPVLDVRVDRHAKRDKPASLKVTYFGPGVESHCEYVCLGHTGYARQKAVIWWMKRFGAPVPNSTEEALPDLFATHALAAQLKQITREVTVAREGKYTRVEGHRLEGRTDAHALAH